MELQHLTIPCEWKSTGDTNVLTGYASVFGNVDGGGDVVVRGAFAKSVNRIKAHGIPLLADHVASTANVLGRIFDAAEDEHGLVIHAKLSSTQSAQDVRTKMREGILSGLSIGYEVLDATYGQQDGHDVRYLNEVKLWETSVVVFAMNEEAMVTSAKAADVPSRRRLQLDLLEAEVDIVRLLERT
jgi:HK97 family phage prohead protease